MAPIQVGKDLNRVEIGLALLETKLNSIPWLEANLKAGGVSDSKIQEKMGNDRYVGV